MLHPNEPIYIYKGNELAFPIHNHKGYISDINYSNPIHNHKEYSYACECGNQGKELITFHQEERFLART